MKYAIVDGTRQEASPGARGACPVCGAILTPRCGKIRVPHWAHPPGIVDHRWEPETAWHRAWKAPFPRECQEVVLQAVNGEKHIADVKTAHGRVLEFQHSSISDEERRSREEFHRPMYWIVDGQKLKRDRLRFTEALRYGRVASVRPWTMIAPIRECVLLRKWADSRVWVFFDFGESDEGGEVYRFGAPILWALEPGRQTGLAVLKPVFRQKFIDAMLRGEHPRGIVFPKAFERVLQIPVPSRPPHRQSFEAYLERKRRARTWKRF